MKILHVATHSGVYRGGAVQLCRMAMTQKKRGHEVEVVANAFLKSGPEKEKEHQETWKPLLDSGVPVRFLAYSRLGGLFKLRKIFKENFDIVHAHRDDALVASWLALWGMDKPALIAQRGTTSKPPGWAARAFRSPRVRAVVAVAEAVKKSLAKSANVPREKIHVVYGSVDTEKFRPMPPRVDLKEQLGIPADAPVIGSLSAYRKAKRLEMLLHALKPVLEKYPNAHAVFLGSGTRKKVGPVAEKLGIAERCHFAGHQTNMPDWISIMDFTVLTARDREGLSGVLRESLAMEIPVISTDCSGNPEIVRDQETGLLIPVENKEKLIEAMDWALKHPAEMKRMAKAGRGWVLENCTMEVQGGRIGRIYRNSTAAATSNNSVPDDHGPQPLP